MASYGEVEESLDFDFFESPRHQNEDVHLKSPTSKPPKGLEPDSKQRASDKSVLPKSSHSAKSRSPSVSASDSYSSDPASEIDIGPSHNKTKEDTDHKKKSKLKKTSSNSSFSSTGSNSSRSRSLSRHSRSLSRSGSDRDGSDKSKSDSSLSSDSDTERPSNPVAKSPASSMPKRGRSRLGEDEYSSSAYSEGEDEKNSPSESSRKDSKHKDSAKKDKIKHMQAWSERPSSNTKPKTRDSKTRPKTANARASGSTRSTLASSGRMHRGSDSETLSDSDITDVSPMDSPRIQGGSAAISNKRGRGGKGKGGRVSASGDGAGDKTHKFMALPVNGLELGEDGGDELQPSRHSRDGRDASGLDLEILMKAVGELEKQKRVQANSRRVMFAPMGASREKNNYTFDQSKTRDIERENQRLLNEIVRRVNSTTDQKKQFYASPKPTYKLTPSAINRERDMKRIESENMAFLKRLQKVKPTTAICRDHQLKSYENTTLHGVSIAALHPLPGRNSRGTSEMGSSRRRSGASSVADTASSIGSRTRSMTSINSGVSSVRSSKRGSRPNSATVRPGSATKRLDTRPEWNNRW